MPVDKFGHTDGGGSDKVTPPIQRVVSGGVTLSQVTDNFLRRDGTNAATGDMNLDFHKLVNVGNPTDNHDATPKAYVDSIAASKVSRRGGTVIGDLKLSIGIEDLRTMGCDDLRENKRFHIYLGDNSNMIKCRKTDPVSLETSNGLLCKFREHEIIRFGVSPDDLRTHVYQDIIMNDRFIANLQDPHSQQDAATKNYVDSNLSGRVLKNGDTMSGDLFLTCGSDSMRSLGCNDLSGHKTFHLYLGDEGNQIKCRIGQPLLMQATTGVLFKLGGHDVLRLGKTAIDSRIEVYKDILLEQNFIKNLHDPENAQDAATKRYVDRTPKKNFVGYIPPLEGNLSITGFVSTASSSSSAGSPYKAFNPNMKGFWATNNDRPTGWIQIKCPDRVRIWRVALKAKYTVGKNIGEWNLSASNDGTSFTTLLTSTTAIEGASNASSFFEVTTAESYQYFRMNVTASTGSNEVGVQYMQLYVYDV